MGLKGGVGYRLIIANRVAAKYSAPYYSLGLMSGTSMDGVDASIIQSDGETKYKVIVDQWTNRHSKEDVDH